MVPARFQGRSQRRLGVLAAGQIGYSPMAEQLNILVVDDDADYRKLSGAFLQRLGHRCLCANDGRQAVEMYREQRPDAVLMDIIMPVMNGIEAVAAILDDDPGAQIVFVTVLDEFPEGAPRDIIRAFDILQKPTSVRAMGSIVDKLKPRPTRSDVDRQEQQ